MTLDNLLATGQLLRQPADKTAIQKLLAAAARRQTVVVGDQHKGRSHRVRQFQHLGKHRIGGAAIQIAGGLIRQHAVGPGHQRPGNGHALALAAREFAGAVVQAVGQAHTC